MDLIYMKYTHPLTIIAPDRSHTIELINNVQDKTNDLAYYINKLSDLAETIQRNTKWTKKVYLGGAKPQTLTGEVIFNIEHFIADVENDYHRDCMTPYRLLRIHQEISDFLHYQSHIRFAATTSIPPGTRPANEQEQEAILEFLREERQQIRLFKSLLDTVDANDQELILRYEDSPVTRDEDWGAFAWGPLPQWEELPPPQE
jgi:hypothetical protein